jgi:hypothetical protein
VTDAAAGGGGIDRREFLRLAALGAGSLAALPLLEACSKGSSAEQPVPQPFRTLVSTLRSKPGLQVFPGAGDLIARTEQRFPFGMTDLQGTAVLADARVWVGQGRLATGPFPASAQRYAHLEHAGDPHGFLVATIPVPAPGLAWVMAQANGRYGFSAIQPLSVPAARAVGQRAIPVATPTIGHPRGVKTVCTRRPPCPMHGLRLDEALRARKPVVFTIASPLLCTSRTCGPVLDEVIDVRARSGKRALFVHAEPYKGDTATALSPTATAWRIPSEPWVWVIDRTGVVRARFEGPVVAAEIEPILKQFL